MPRLPPPFLNVLAGRSAALALAAALAACSTMPDERATPGELPEAWLDAPAGAADPQSLDDWWRGFNDPLLDALVADALENGGSVQLAALRLREARALSYSTLAAYLPRVDGFARGDYTQSLDGPDLQTSDLSGLESEQMVGAYGPQVSWEIPLFGRISAAAAGARANNRAALADLRGAKVALAADVAQAYIDLRAAQQSQAALEEAVVLSDQLAGIVETSAQAGFASIAEAADARRLAETNRARLPNLRIEALRAERVLAVLRGRAPGTEEASFAQSLQTIAAVPSMRIDAVPAQPADLVRLRPDVAQAEAQALLAAADVGLARSDLLPQLNLTGSIAVTDNLIGNAVGENAATLSLTPLISIPLFGWGQRWAQVRVRDARFDQALVQYRDTVNGAVSEAANALTALDQGNRRLIASRRAEEAAEATARGSRAAYGAGIQSLADRLRSEQQLIDARLARIDAEAQAARAGVNMYRAFGGGPSI
ncbi:MAG: efflux transporter outer membrane subunit [Hyphomonadaceae bacterium]